MHPSYYVSGTLGTTQFDEHVLALRTLTINRRDCVISRPRKLWGHGTGRSQQAFCKMMVEMSRSWLDKREGEENSRQVQRLELPIVPCSCRQSPFFPYWRGGGEWREQYYQLFNLFYLLYPFLVILYPPPICTLIYSHFELLSTNQSLIESLSPDTWIKSFSPFLLWHPLYLIMIVFSCLAD